MNFNFIDSNRDDAIDKSEYKFYLKQIGLDDLLDQSTASAASAQIQSSE